MLKAKQKLVSIFTALAILLVTALLAVSSMFTTTPPTRVMAATTEIVFDLGSNGSASHSDGSKTATTYEDAKDGYALKITNATNMYTDARDAQGNGCFKLGSSKKTGGFSFSVPEDVISVVIAVAKYKANTSKVTVNDTTYTLTKNSNDGAYDAIIIDTTSNKTITLITVSGGLRAMVNTITYVVKAPDSGETPGDGEDSSCEHINATYIWDDGLLTHKKSCPDCDEVFESETCKPNENHTCETCGHVYDSIKITYSALGETTEQSVTKGFPVKLTTPDETPVNAVFVGWTTENKAVADNTCPEYISIEVPYTETNENKELFALYKQGGCNLVTDASALKIGDQVVIAANGQNYALSTTQNNNNRGQAAITKNGTSITFGNDVQILTLEAGKTDGTFAFNTGSGYLYAASSSNNYLRTEATLSDNSSWTIEITTSGVATIKAQGEYTRNTLQYNQTSSLFACYSSASQKPVSIYKQEPAIYFTELFANIDSASLTIGEDITVNYYVSMSEVFADAKLQYTIGEDKTVCETTGEVQSDGRYKFSVGLPPHYMTNNINATLVFNGRVLDSMTEYSIATYVNNQLEKIKDSTEDKDAKLRNLLNSILAYGEAAKNYCAENESVGVENTIPEKDEDGNKINVFHLENADLTNKEVTSYVVWFTGANLLFDYDNKICVTLSSTENVKLRVKINDGKYTDYTPTSTAFLTDGILPTAFDSVYTFELYYDGVLMQTLTYSVNSYAYKMQQNTKIGALCVALYNYGVAAKAYQA